MLNNNYETTAKEEIINVIDQMVDAMGIQSAGDQKKAAAYITQELFEALAEAVDDVMAK